MGKIEKRKKFVDSWLFKIINIPKKTTSECRNLPPLLSLEFIDCHPHSIERDPSHHMIFGWDFVLIEKFKSMWHSFSIYPIELWVSLLRVPGGDWYYFAGWGGRQVGRQAARQVLKSIYSLTHTLPCFSFRVTYYVDTIMLANVMGWNGR